MTFSVSRYNPTELAVMNSTARSRAAAENATCHASTGCSDIA